VSDLWKSPKMAPDDVPLNLHLCQSSGVALVSLLASGKMALDWFNHRATNWRKRRSDVLDSFSMVFVTVRLSLRRDFTCEIPHHGTDRTRSPMA
jgi:hypothetical protein